MKVAALKITTLILMLILASGCTTAPLKTDGSESLEANEGLMAVRFISDWKGNESKWFESISFSVHPEGATMSEVLEMRSNDDAQLIALPAGNYEFVRTAIGTNYLLLDAGGKFSVRAGEITYVGDLTINVLQKPFLLAITELVVENNQETTMSRLREEYGELIKDYPVTAEIMTLNISNEKY